MEKVRPTLEPDVQKLAGEFKGYIERLAAMYVSDLDVDGHHLDVTEEDIAKWGPHWRAENTRFEEFLEADDDYKDLRGKMFFVYDGNHRVKAWRQTIDTVHRGQIEWYQKHGCPECVLLDCSNGGGDILNAMDSVNK